MHSSTFYLFLNVVKLGKQYTYAAYNVKVIESALKDENSKTCFEYLKDIADVVGLEKNGENILLSSYNKIKFIDNGYIVTVCINKSRTVQSAAVPIWRIGRRFEHNLRFAPIKEMCIRDR